MSPHHWRGLLHPQGLFARRPIAGYGAGSLSDTWTDNYINSSVVAGTASASETSQILTTIRKALAEDIGTGDVTTSSISRQIVARLTTLRALFPKLRADMFPE